jgi:hypothetical protein
MTEEAQLVSISRDGTTIILSGFYLSGGPCSTTIDLKQFEVRMWHTSDYGKQPFWTSAQRLFDALRQEQHQLDLPYTAQE